MIVFFKFAPQEHSEALLCDDSAEPRKCVHRWGHYRIWINSISMPYSPDLTTSDFHLFVTLKDSLLGQ
jgi:hypothetical protein